MMDEINVTEVVDNSYGPGGGHMEFQSAKTGFWPDHRIPGSVMTYRCSHGFDIGEGQNPDQDLKCTAGRKVDFSGVSRCKRRPASDS